MARRRKEERRAGSASRGIVRRLGRFSSRVRHRGVPERDRVPARCNSSGAAVNVCSDAPAGAQRAKRVADGGVVYVSRALSVSPSAPRINAQRVARFHPLVDPQLLATKEITSRDTVGIGDERGILPDCRGTGFTRKIQVHDPPPLSREESGLIRYLSTFISPFTSCHYSRFLLAITLFSADDEKNRLSFVVWKRILFLR